MTALLEIRNLAKHFHSRDRKSLVRAVDGVSLTVERGKTLGIVGESGCGKSTLARLIVRLIEATAGEVMLEGENVLTLDARRMRARRRDLQMVFQDPYASLDPRMTVGQIVAEPLEIHAVGTARDRREKVAELLRLVGLDPRAGSRYPHEFSGGQRQRIGIARAIALEPKLLVLDEPVSALDLSIQSQVLNLLMDLKSRLGLSYIFISHDLSVVEHVSDEIAVMYLGKVVERGPAVQLLTAPLHPYTRALISAIPEIDPAKRRSRIVLPGDPPSPESIPTGCRFHPRCPMAAAICATADPQDFIDDARQAACHFAQPGRSIPGA